MNISLSPQNLPQKKASLSQQAGQPPVQGQPPAQQQPPVQQQPAPQPPSEEPPRDAISWSDAGTGLATGLASGVISGAGMGLSAAKHSVIGTAQAYKALYKNETIGPILKTALGAVLPIATVGVPVLSAVIGAGVGIYKGFVAGAHDGAKAGLQAGVDLVKEFNQDAKEVRNAIEEFGNEKLEEGEERLEISPLRGVEAIGAGFVGAAIGAVGIGGSTIINVPRAFVLGNKAINKSDMGLPMKAVSHTVSIPLAPLAAAAGPLGGGIFGLLAGTYHGYNEGFSASVAQNMEYVGKYNEYVGKGLSDLAEDLVD